MTENGSAGMPVLRQAQAPPVLRVDVEEQLVIRTESLDCLSAIGTKLQNRIEFIGVIVDELFKQLSCARSGTSEAGEPN